MTVSQGEFHTGQARIATPQRPRRRVRVRVVALVLAGLLGLCTLAFVGGFALFVTRMAAQEPSRPRPADAIVVLTGGASRVSDGLQLLAEGRGKRLLITGVNRTTSADELRRMLPASEEVLECCVDLGHKALNTWGNAIEAAEWARARQFRSLVVVTSAYHMPRALFELERALPDVSLQAYPVVTDRMQRARWWAEPDTAKLLLKEYLKYMMAQAKIRPAQAVAPVEAAQPADTQASAIR